MQYGQVDHMSHCLGQSWPMFAILTCPFHSQSCCVLNNVCSASLQITHHTLLYTRVRACTHRQLSNYLKFFSLCQVIVVVIHANLSHMTNEEKCREKNNLKYLM